MTETPGNQPLLTDGAAGLVIGFGWFVICAVLFAGGLATASTPSIRPWEN